VTLIERVRRRAKELDHELILALGRGGYSYEKLDDRDLLEAVEKELAASRINHPVPGQAP